MKVIVVWGAPCSGKTTYVRERIGEKDVVFDFDTVLKAVSTRTLHTTQDHPARRIIIDWRKALVRKLDSYQADVQTLFITAAWLSEELKQSLAPYAPVYVKMRTRKDVCVERLEADDTRPDKAEWREIIERWFEDYPEEGPMNKERKCFYNFTRNEQSGADELHIDGEIVSDVDWWGPSGQVVARRFRQRLAQCGDVTVYINSPGGDVFAGAEVYTALREHKGKITVKVTGIAASAASVVAMAGDEVLMSPVAYMMIHDPWTYAAGNAREFEHQADVLREIGEGLIAAYTAKTGKGRDEIAAMLEAETYMNAQRCVDEGFADGILYEQAAPPDAAKALESHMMQGKSYGPRAVLNQIRAHAIPPAGKPPDTDAALRGEIAQRAAFFMTLYPET